MASSGIRTLLKERTQERDRIVFAAGDVLDVKAGLVLVVLTFLAGQAFDLFKDVRGSLQVGLATISLGAVAIGTVFALIQWFPVQYGVLSHPAKYKPWLDDLLRRHAERNVSADVTLAHLDEIEIAQATQRIDRNERFNRRKLFLMKGCFVCVSISLLANIANVTLKHLFP